MPSPVYTKRFYGAAGQVGISPPGSHIVPAGFVWVLRDFDVVYSGTFGSSTRLIGNKGQTIWFNEFQGGDVAQYASWRGRQALFPGDQFQISSVAPTDVTLSGYQLTLP